MNIEKGKEWDFYFCQVEGRPASIMLNLALKDIAPITEKKELVYCFVSIRKPNSQGLTNSSEAEVLYLLEDRLAIHMQTNLGGLYVARNTSNKKREFYFYCNSSIDYKGVLAEVMDDFPEYAYTCGAKTDDDWAFYNEFLYPNEAEFQSIKNRHQIRKHESKGDALREPREVEHSIVFENALDCTRFGREIKHKNFQALLFETSPGLNQYELTIKRADSLDYHSMDELVRYLFEKAKEFNGEYRGWDAKVVKTRPNNIES